MSDKTEVTLLMHENILGDIPRRMREHAKRLDAKVQSSVTKAATVIDGWMAQKGPRKSCTRPYASWEWLRDVCVEMKSYAAATVIEAKLAVWCREREETEKAAALKAARIALEVEEASQDGR